MSKFEKEMNQKFNALWEQCIEAQKRNVEHWLKENNKELVKLNRDILQRMKEQYAKVKLKT